MSTQANLSNHPSCFGLFDPVATECACCSLSGDCIQQQEQQLSQLSSEIQIEIPMQEVSEEVSKQEALEEVSKQEALEEVPVLEEDDPDDDSDALNADIPNTQIIRKHLRKRLEIPAVGTKLFTTYKGQVFEAVVIDDPANQSTGGRSIFFNGEVYKTLTAAAHAIAPGINSGSVWQPA